MDMESLPFTKDGKVHSIQLGATFRKRKQAALHTLRYDFTPASVDVNQQGKVEVSENNEVEITLPHMQGSKNSSTVYKGSKKTALKECVLIYDPSTGNFTLERITSQIQVKKTRIASGNKPVQTLPQNSAQLKHKPSSKKSQMTKKVTSSGMKSVKQQLPPLQMRKVEPAAAVEEKSNDQDYSASISPKQTNVETFNKPHPHSAIVQSSTLSSSDDSSSSSSSSSDDEDGITGSPLTPGNASELGHTPIHQNQLHDDLHLTSSGSDSD